MRAATVRVSSHCLRLLSVVVFVFVFVGRDGGGRLAGDGWLRRHIRHRRFRRRQVHTLLPLITVPARPFIFLSVLFVVVCCSGGRGGGGLALVIKSSTVVRSYEERAVLIARVKHYAPCPFTHPFNRLLVASLSLSLPLPYRLISAPPMRRLQANRGRMVTISLHGYIFFGR